MVHNVQMGQGVPVGWEHVAEIVAEEFGHVLLLTIAPEAFRSNDAMIDVFVDGKLAGGLEFEWDDCAPLSDVLDDLLDRVTELLVQDLGSGV